MTNLICRKANILLFNYFKLREDDIFAKIRKKNYLLSPFLVSCV